MKIVLFLFIIMLITTVTSEFHEFVNLGKFHNTQIVSAAVCPKCLEVNYFNNNNEDSDKIHKIAFNNCKARKKDIINKTYNNQRFNIIPYSSSSIGIYNILNRDNKSINPFPYNKIYDENNTNSNTISNFFEMMSVEDDGGHYIKLLDRDLCLYHNHKIINKETSKSNSLYIKNMKTYDNKTDDYNYYSFFYPNRYLFTEYTEFSYDDYFLPCNIDEDSEEKKYFKFYFFQHDYIFPEYKINVRVLIYDIYKENNREFTNFINVLKGNSLIKFTELTTLDEKTIYFNDENILEAQLYEGNWEVSVIVKDEEKYYYKNTPNYYFPISQCNEDKEYGVEIPIRRLQTDIDPYGSTSTNGNAKIYLVYARRDVYIKNLNITYISKLL